MNAATTLLRSSAGKMRLPGSISCSIIIAHWWTMKTSSSPEVVDLSWGQVWLNGFREPFKDVKIYPGGARAWDWRETNTHHSPGIQPADVQELLDHGARIVILSTGMLKRLEVQPRTIHMLETADIEHYVEDTKAAVRLFNKLRRSEPVGILIHSTC